MLHVEVCLRVSNVSSLSQVITLTNALADGIYDFSVNHVDDSEIPSCYPSSNKLCS